MSALGWAARRAEKDVHGAFAALERRVVFMTERALRELASGVHVAEAKQGFYGLELGARMTVLETSGGLLVHSPIAIDPERVASLGTPRWVLAPNLFHHLYAGAWIDAGLEGWCAAELPKKRPDLKARVVPPDTQPFGSDVEVLPLTCFSFSNEVVVLHRPSRTLVVTDLCFNLPATAPFWTRLAMRAIGGYPGVSSTLLERFGMQREIARRELGTIASWDFDRVILGHGDVVERGGKDAFVGAFRWLGLLDAPRLTRG